MMKRDRALIIIVLTMDPSLLYITIHPWDQVEVGKKLDNHGRKSCQLEGNFTL